MHQWQLFPLFLALLIGSGNVRPALAVVPESKHGLRHILSLDGGWQIIFDRENTGKSKDLHQRTRYLAQPDRVPIPVPAAWEEIEQDYQGVGWYYREFRIPESWAGKVVRLQFGAVNYQAEIWINDVVIGHHSAGYTPFEFDITDLIRPGRENWVIVRVSGPPVTVEEVDGIAWNTEPHWRGAIAGGIWQSVTLCATAGIYAADVFAAPNQPEEIVTVHTSLNNTGDYTREIVLTNAVLFDGTVVAKAVTRRRIPPGSHSLESVLKLPDPAVWSPDTPNLYRLKTEIQCSGEVIDTTSTRFGMREFTVKNGDFYLNGEKIFIKAGFWEGVYPTTLVYPPDADFVRNEIQLAKEAGFNVLRPWRKPPPPPILDLADEMGICILNGPPIEWLQGSPYMEERVRTEVRELILRDRNHPSVICWELFNEIARNYDLERLKRPMTLLARSLDPSRLIQDESGGWGGGSSPRVPATFYPPYSAEPVKFNDVHSYLRAPVDQRTYEFYRTLPGGDTLTFVSEVGYGGFPSLPDNAMRYRAEGRPITVDYRYHTELQASLEHLYDSLQLDEVFESVSDLCHSSQQVQAEGNKLQLEALRINSDIDGYVLHAFTDGDWVLGAGILDIWRKPKLAYETAKQVNQPLYLVLRGTPENVYPGRTVRITFTSVNEKEPVSGTLTLSVNDPLGTRVFRQTLPVTVPTGIARISETSFRPVGVGGRYTIHALLQDDDETHVENTFSVFSFSGADLTAPTQTVRVLDPAGKLRPFLAAYPLKTSSVSGAATGVTIIVVPDREAATGMLSPFAQTMDAVKEGGKAIILETPVSLKRLGYLSRTAQTVLDTQLHSDADHPLMRRNLFPVAMYGRIAYGNWIPVNHFVRQHPVFEGLPSGVFMGQLYRNVCALKTLTSLPPASDIIVGSMSYEYQGRPYTGVHDFWAGADLAIVPHGKGKLILSTLQLVDHLSTDPVADRLLLNMIRYASRL